MNERDPVIRIEWDHSAAARLRSARLEISDGKAHHRLTLDPSALSYGSVVYIPLSTDLRFDLVAGGRIIDTVRLVGDQRFDIESNSADRSASPSVRPPGPLDFRLPPSDVRRIPAPR